MDLFIHHVVMMVVSTFVVMSVISIIVMMDVVVVVFFLDNWGHNNWLCIVATVEARVV